VIDDRAGSTMESDAPMPSDILGGAVWGLFCPGGECYLTDPSYVIAKFHADRADGHCPCGASLGHFVRRMHSVSCCYCHGTATDATCEGGDRG
jgi:hypothetical protein